VSISSIGIQTVTPSTGTPQDKPQQQQSAANDNSSQVSAKSGSQSSSQTTGQHVDKMA
jgi:hypothetical protein